MVRYRRFLAGTDPDPLIQYAAMNRPEPVRSGKPDLSGQGPDQKNRIVDHRSAHIDVTAVADDIHNLYMGNAVELDRT